MDYGRKNFAAAKNIAARGRRCSAWCSVGGRGCERAAKINLSGGRSRLNTYRRRIDLTAVGIGWRRVGANPGATRGGGEGENGRLGGECKNWRDSPWVQANSHSATAWTGAHGVEQQFRAAVVVLALSSSRLVRRRWVEGIGWATARQGGRARAGGLKADARRHGARQNRMPVRRAQGEEEAKKATCSPPFSSRPVFPRRAAVAVAFLHPARDQRCRHRGSCRGQGSSESGMASPDACVEDKVHRIFLDFMTKVARYDELVDAGKKVLLKFHQEVEHFWRPKLLTESSAIIEIVKSNYSDRMRSYLEAGCTHHNEIIQNMNRSKLLLEELQFLEEDVYSAALTASLSSSRNTDDCPDHDNLTNVCSEDEQQPEDWLDGAVSFASVIVLVHNMLKMDYMMQVSNTRICIWPGSLFLRSYKNNGEDEQQHPCLTGRKLFVVSNKDYIYPWV
uniref:DUF7795 domain-containing protein n=1 Tax=Oryza sativa subsp. japonica TaxID=39947 RepID=Q9AUN7_ORYSJ|nr:Hypothetical protein [Oryza sativa Japonica Group]